MRRSEGDLYLKTWCRLVLAGGRARDGAYARRSVDEAMAEWSRGDFDLMAFFALRARVYADLFEGLVVRAWSTLRDAWPRVAETVMPMIPSLALMAQELRGMVAAGAASE